MLRLVMLGYTMTPSLLLFVLLVGASLCCASLPLIF